MEPLAELVGESPAVAIVRTELRQLLQRSRGTRRVPSILLQGETGTGKGLVARALHRAGPRCDGPFIEINCAAIPETLLEAELFGFERGAFTDARQAKPGLFQAAHGGTLFLDEIGLMPASLQAKLLKVIEDRQVRRLGSTRNEAVDVAIIAATSEELSAAAADRRFRPDLYHRLAAITIALPALRDRGSDILLLGEHFLGRACADYAVAPKTLTAEAQARMMTYHWPGNVRELANVMERVAALSEASAVTAAMLGLPDRAGTVASDVPPATAATSLDDAIRVHVLDVLNGTGWNISRASALLQISRNTLRWRIEKYGLRRGAAGTAAPIARPRARGGPPPQRPAEAENMPGATRSIAFLGIALVPPSGNLPILLGNDHLDIIEDKVKTFGGRVEAVRPTSVVAVFGLGPVDHPAANAVHAALAIKHVVQRAVTDPERLLAVKAVLHVADCQLSPESTGYALDALAKEEPFTVLNALAEGLEPDSILVSAAAIPFLQHRFALAPISTDDGGLQPALLVTRIPPISGKPSIAVMPFRNMTGDPEQEYFGDGITEGIIGGLSRFRWLFVIARTSTLTYKSSSLDVRRIAGELAVRYLLTGTVRRIGQHLRVTADLIDAETQTAMWTERYDGNLSDIFDFQEQITARIVATLDTKVRGAEIERALHKRPESLDAYDCVLRALSLVHRLFTPDFFRADELLQRATTLDPQFGAAYAWRAWWYLLKLGEGTSWDEADIEETNRLAEAALERDPDDSMALAISGHAASFLRRDYDRALRRFERSLALNPNSAFAWGLSGATFCYVGEPIVARDRALYAMRLSPFDLFTFYFASIAGLGEMLTGRYEEAVTWAMKSRSEKPRYSANLRKLAACLAHLGRLEEARAIGQEFLALQTGFTLLGFRQHYALRDRAALETYIENLRTAGLPE
jgi:transcriptional regulator with AAA-type ATPase domain/TolB-like protein/tetratricopeptide (TPR) repeat protein